MSIPYQTLQCLLDSRQRVGFLFHACIKVKEVNTELQASILLPDQHHNLHHALWLGWIVPDSSISHRWFWTSLTRGRGICLNCSLKGVSLVILIVCSVEWVQLNSMGSNKNTAWYSANKQQVASTNSGGQESNPLKSSSLNNFPCLCLTVNLWGDNFRAFPPSVPGDTLVVI